MSTRARLYLDLGLFAALLVAYNPSWGGNTVHEWLCVITVVPLLFHVIVNWDQTLRILRRFTERIRTMSKIDLVVDAALFVAAVTVMLSGLLISQAVAGALGITIAPSSLWITVHSISADATIALLLVHFVLHWKWIVKAAGRLGRPSPAGCPSPAARPSSDPTAEIALATARSATAPPEAGPASAGSSRRL